MQKLLRPLAIVALVAVAAFALASASNNNNNNDSAEEAEQNISIDGGESQDGQSENSEDSANEYSYTAQSGDSYIKMARKAVQAYDANNEIELSQAEIIAAETFITSDAGFPQLNLGQEVKFEGEVIKAAAEKAKALDDVSEARWAKYVPYVNFDTSSVGVAQS